MCHTLAWLFSDPALHVRACFRLPDDLKKDPSQKSPCMCNTPVHLDVHINAFKYTILCRIYFRITINEADHYTSMSISYSKNTIALRYVKRS